ncbi:MAG: MBL fold metallo-hydrolase [Lentimicrobiaceae bacterium]|nr:MBL fold metallo-hydrolase [Lentimicrobiaceae bacterium]
MKIELNKVILTVIFSLISFFSFSQSENIDITFIGNCGFFMTDGKMNIYVDFPYKSGAHDYMTYDFKLLDSIQDYSIFLYTHAHADHYSKKLFKKTNQKLYGPWPITLYLSGKQKYKLKAINDSIPSFFITEFKTKHSFSFRNCSYLIVWNGKRIYISGDAETADNVCKMKNIDLVITPYWVIMDAFNRNLKIDTKKIILCHHKTRDNITTEDEKIIIPSQNQKIELK